MVTEVIPESQATVELPIVVSATTAADLTRAAEAMGVSVSSYFLLLHAMHTGRASRSFVASLSEVLVQDKEILRELAK